MSKLNNLRARVVRGDALSPEQQARLARLLTEARKPFLVRAKEAQSSVVEKEKALAEAKAKEEARRARQAKALEEAKAREAKAQEWRKEELKKLQKQFPRLSDPIKRAELETGVQAVASSRLVEDLAQKAKVAGLTQPQLAVIKAAQSNRVTISVAQIRKVLG